MILDDAFSLTKKSRGGEIDRVWLGAKKTEPEPEPIKWADDNDIDFKYSLQFNIKHYTGIDKVKENRFRIKAVRLGIRLRKSRDRERCHDYRVPIVG
jgi:hypothetical protein